MSLKAEKIAKEWENDSLVADVKLEGPYRYDLKNASDGDNDDNDIFVDAGNSFSFETNILFILFYFVLL